VDSTRVVSSAGEGISDPATWVDRHGDALFRFALLRVRNAERAEDLVQETFLAALHAREAFSGHSSERTWLIGILKRKAVDQMRRMSRESSEPDEDAVAPADAGFFTVRGKWRMLPERWAGDPHRTLEEKEFWKAFGRCLTELPPRLADAFCLHEVEELDGREVCKVLDISPTNLWTQLHRARLALRRCLEIHWFGRRAKVTKP
jgi:RNA polymerase sigma-70 factor, ECF subfamily